MNNSFLFRKKNWSAFYWLSSLLVTACLFYSPSTYAQNKLLLETKDLSQVQVADLTSQEVSALFQQANQYGIDEEKLYQMLAERGMPELEVLKLRTRRMEADVAKPIVPEAKSQKITDEGRKDETVLAMAEATYDKSIYGSELFSKNSTVFEPNLRIATPSSYVLGPDDELIVNVYGYSEKQYNLEVSKEGQIYIPNVGPMDVNGLTIAQATTKIRNKLASTIYTALQSGATHLQVSLGKIKSIQVTVIGEVKKPGTYTVSSLTTLFNLLYLCGGPNDLGSYRTIQIVRGNQVARTVDMYKFLSGGDRSDDVLLQERDVVRVPYCEQQIQIKGKVLRPGKFEWAGTDRFQQMLNYCGGLSNDAYKNSITVYRVGDKSRMVIDLKKDSFSKFVPQAGDLFYVSEMPVIFSNKVTVNGSILIPGSYALSQQLTLRNLLEKAGGLLPDAFTKRVVIYRYFNNKLPTTAAFNLDSLINHNTDVPLVKDDSVWVYSVLDFKEDAPIYVEGNVKNPGIFPWRDHLTLRDVIARAGGINDAGDSSNIEISRRIKTSNVKAMNNLESEIITFNLSTDTVSLDLELSPYDVVVVKRKSGMVTQRMVSIDGEVDVPGKYILKSSGDRVMDIIKRAGGFKASADSNYVTIRRLNKSNFSKEEKQAMYKRLFNVNNDTIEKSKKIITEINKTYDMISVNLQSVSGNESSSSDNMLLEDGDIILINKKTNLVKVSGEVYYPNIIALKGNKSARYYIKQAGNFMSTARKSKTMVVYPNGKAKSVKSFLFFKKYPKVVSGSEIFVPQKNNKNKKGLSIAEWSVVVSSLALIANLINSLK